MPLPSLISYISNIDIYNKKELEEEEKKLVNLINNLYQEYRDRRETIDLVSKQLDEVRNRLYTSENQTF